MSSSAKILILFVALQLLLAATLPQISYSLELAGVPPLTEVVQHEGSNSLEETLAQPVEREIETLQNTVSAATVEEVKDSSIGLTDFTEDDPLEDRVSVSEESAKSAPELDASSHTLGVIDTDGMEIDDRNVIEDVKAELTNVESFLEPVETINEELAGGVNRIPGDIALMEEEKTLQSTIDAVKPGSILEPIGDTGYLQDAIDYGIDELEASDLGVVKELAPTIASSVREVEEPAIALADLDVQEISDEILQETIDPVKKTIKQTDIAVVEDLIKEWEASTTLEEIEIPDDLGAEKIQGDVLQSLTDTDSLLTQSIMD